MGTVLLVIRWVACLVILAEALNKLERVAPFARGKTLRERFSAWLAVVAWGTLAISVGAVLIGPFMPGAPQMFDIVPSTAAACAFAVLIMRPRMRDNGANHG
jgi:hypothetical protein